jgi:hypothetical protein
MQDAPAASAQRERTARLRAAHEREQRVRQALEHLPQVEAKKKAAEKAKARVSTTDPEARVMKMADGGFRPAFNGQFCTDTEPRSWWASRSATKAATRVSGCRCWSS